MERHEPEAEKPFSSRSVVDLSHVVDNGTKSYPGDPARAWIRRLTSRTTAVV